MLVGAAYNVSALPLRATKGDENWRLVAAVSRWQAGGPPHTGSAVDRPEDASYNRFQPAACVFDGAFTFEIKATVASGQS